MACAVVHSDVRSVPIRLPNGTFRNSVAEQRLDGFRELWRWMREHPRYILAPTPPRNSFPVAKPVVARPRAGAGEFTATWIGQATVLMQIGGMNVLTDPMFSEHAYACRSAR